MEAAGRKRSAEKIMADMQHLHYVLSVTKGSRTPVRRIETPNKTQNEVLSAFGYCVYESGVLQGPANSPLPSKVRGSPRHLSPKLLLMVPCVTFKQL